MALLLYRLGRFSARRSWLVIAIWTVVMGLVGGSAALFHGQMTNNFQIPGTETQQMADKLKADLPDSAGGTGTVVFTTGDGSSFTQAQKDAVSAALKDVTSVSNIRGVIDPFTMQATSDGAAAQIADGKAQLAAGQAELDASKAQLDGLKALFPAAQAQYDAGMKQYEEGTATLAAKTSALLLGERTAEAASGIRFVSENGQAAVAAVQFDVSINAVSPKVRAEVQEVLNKASSSGVEVFFSKDITEDVSSLFGISEAVGIAVAALVLIIMLGTLIAAGLPLLMAVVGVGVGVGGTFALTGAIEMSSISPMLALMLGLAVGIDYSLFIVNRHRQQLLAGMEMRESIAKATGTSGNAVLFAGLTVVIALAALSVTGLPFLAVLGLAAAATVAVAVVIALTLTPALLSLIGTRLISKRAWAKNAAHHATHTAAEDAAADAAHAGRGWGGLVTRFSVPALVVSVLALIVVALPAAGLRLALPDGGSEPVDSSAYQAYSITGENFGAGMNGPIIVVASLPEGLDKDAATSKNLDIAAELRTVPNVTAAVPMATSDDLRTSIIQVVPAEGPASASTVAVVSDLRAAGAAIESTTGATIGLTGQTAANVDVSAKLGAALPTYLAIVVGLSLILLILVFRSILVPLLATAGFLLSLAAAFGGVVAVYQWGWLGGVFDVANPGAVLSFLPIILIGVLFGLAMDYQVFIASGMREAYVHGQDAKTAVRTGFSHAAPVVTAAAIIMTSVFAGFIFSHLTMVRPLGFALAFGVLIDAFVVRMTIVPAAMHLLGRSAWWLPAWLERILPDVDVEGAKLGTLVEAERDAGKAETELETAQR
ncbi:MMPL family transporter [Arthrobacter sp. 35W]|uniref:MMPL family transporter n=1 Tax=Arthrobacter sp. 35W TaxID=1132441 RepID=UPI00040DE8D7|nr:MMPL family transporter [Arthrobacter sp. 35W]